ncbi:KEOPS complex subunit Pcc1 [Methanonatronarchaeum sp. AMET-Sl]|uniref:KEOPS complex subunit Pcc1 n=1 Tax=Methanonatronarchaeum sp. AMET-Sl TaxID=3037654 RepID=UPI00244DE6ED|nr:KEOPS complex subunit Pcc1 [Methanonatronarchaeum sp. AMET-Sl]WGI16981.1 KEOPS complex subunit Pcc1 [Methanonatronarchaeum sp. AMET-Sl]
MDKPPVEGEMKIETDSPKVLIGALEPDNLPNIQIDYKQKTKDIDSEVREIKIRFSFSSVRQSIASLDDILKCIDVAEEVDGLWR